MLLPILVLPQISNVNVLSPSLPLAPSAGTAGVSANLLTLSNLAAYPG